MKLSQACNKYMSEQKPWKKTLRDPKSFYVKVNIYKYGRAEVILGILA